MRFYSKFMCYIQKVLDSVLFAIVQLIHQKKGGLGMIQLDLKSRKSIYEQIVDGFKELIACGILKEGDKLPSVRELASTLTVNPNTIQKSYSRLESEDWIYTVSGLGCFVAERSHKPDPAALRSLYTEIEECIMQLLFLGVTEKEILAKLQEFVSERGKQA